jgi:hypothetical protein
MKTLTAFLTATVLAVGMTSAMARDQQATGAELDNQLNWSMARTAGAHASAQVPGGIPQSSIDFQAVGTE